MLEAIDAVRIFSSDFEETKAFYVNALGMTIGFESPGVCVYDLKGTKLILEEIDISEPEAVGMVGRFTGISFAVEDIQKTFKEMKSNGVQFEGKPLREDWGGSMVHFLDPDNNVFTLVQYPKQG